MESVSPVFPDTPHGRKQKQLWRQQRRLQHAGHTPPPPPRDAAGGPAPTRLDLGDAEDSDGEVQSADEEEEDEARSRQSKSSRSSDRSRNNDGTRTARAIRRMLTSLTHPAPG